MRNSAKLIQNVTFNTKFLAGKTLMAGDNPDHVYRPGGMDGWILNCTTSGTGRVNRGPVQFQCVKGDLLLFPPAVAHDYGRYHKDPEWAHLWVYFFPRGSWDSLLSWDKTASGVYGTRIEDEPAWERVTRLFEKLITISKSMYRFRFALAMNTLEELLLWCAESRVKRFPGDQDERIKTGIEYIRHHYREPLDVDDIAAVCSLSNSRFAHLFTNVTGAPPMKYLEQHRIRVAQELLLSTRMPVSEVADRCGFNDPLYFSHVFRRVTGRSPRRFRTSG